MKQKARIKILWVWGVLLWAFSAWEAPTKAVLDNGVRMILAPDSSRPLISLALLVDGSSRIETEEFAGVSHMLEHIVVRGPSEKQGILEFRQALWELGQESVYTSSDYVFYSFTVPKDNFDETLWRFVDMTLKLKVTPSEVEKEREVVAQELRMNLDNPWSQLFDTLDSIAFQVHPYRRPVIGFEPVIRHITPERIDYFYRHTFVPENLVIAVVGDFEPPVILKKLNETFGKIQNTDPLPELEPGVQTFSTVSTTKEKEMKTENVYLTMAFPVGEGLLPDRAEWEVFTRILGKGGNSLLHRKLVDTGLAAQAFAELSVRKRGTLLILGALLKDPSLIEKIEQGMLSVLKEAPEINLTPQAVKKAREKVYAEEILNKESFVSRANEYAYWEILGDYSGWDTYIKRLKDLTEEDVIKTLSGWVPEVRYEVVIRPEGTAPVSSVSRFFSLPNGFHIVLRPHTSYPVVAGSLVFPGGVRTEAIPGLNALTIRLLLKGTVKQTAREIADFLDENGIQMGADSDWDAGYLSFRAPSNALPAVFNLLREILQSPSFPPEEIDKVKKEMVSEIRDMQSDNFDSARLLFFRSFFGSTPYANDPRGTEDSLNAIQREDIVSHFKSLFTSANGTLVLVGDMDAFGVMDNLKKTLGRLEKGNSPSSLPPSLTPSSTGVLRNERQSSHQVIIDFGFPAPSAGHPDFVPVLLLRSVLGMSLFKRFVYDEGIAYRMWTRYPYGVNPGIFYIETGVSPEHVKYIQEEVLKEIQKIQIKGVNEEERRHAINRLKTSHLLTATLSSSLASSLTSFEAIGLGSEFWESLPEKLEQVTAEQIQKAAQTYLAPENLLLVYSGPDVDRY